MKIEITHNIDDISEQVIEDVEKAINIRVDAEIKRLTSAIEQSAKTLIDELTNLLDIKDNRQRERVQRAVIRNLDKWTKRGLSNG